MSNTSSIFNTTFFVILGIIIIFIGLTVIYFENKMREQNHKISSMLSLVSSLADELNAVKFHLNHMNIMGGSMKEVPNSINIPINSSETNNLGEKLIDVSDNEDDNEDDDNTCDDDEDNNDEDDDDNDDDDDDDYDDDDYDDDDDDDLEDDDIKILNINIQNDNKNIILRNNQFDNNDNGDDNEDDEVDDNDDDDDDEELNMIETLDIENINWEEDKIEIIEINKKKDNNEKEVLINLEKPKTIEVIDYKKLSLNKLKSLVLEKELVSDSSKLKKNDLLKLLGVE